MRNGYHRICPVSILLMIGAIGVDISGEKHPLGVVEGATENDAGKAERLLRNLVRRREQEAPGVSGSILEGLDEILTVTRRRNVKRWRNARMALRWTGAGMLEAKKGLRHLKAHRQPPVLKASLAAHRAKSRTALDHQARAA